MAVIPIRSSLEIIPKTEDTREIRTENLSLPEGTRIRVNQAPYHLRDLEGLEGTLIGMYDPENDTWAAQFENNGIAWIPFSSLVVTW